MHNFEVRARCDYQYHCWLDREHWAQSVYHSRKWRASLGVLSDTGEVTALVQRLEQAFVSLTPEGTHDALTTVSATRCLSMYRERLGALQMENTTLQSVVNSAFASGDFVSLQPSLLAAVAYLGTREQQGLLPAWPRALAELTGWQGADDSTDAFSSVMVKMRAFLQDRQ